MKFLCLDTTLNNCSIHIVTPGKECLTVSDNQVPPSDVIPILVKKAMLKLNLKISDIDGIIVATGPGNFTSLRVGISCLLYTSPSPRDQRGSRMPSSA